MISAASIKGLLINPDLASQAAGTRQNSLHYLLMEGEWQKISKAR
jgi:hypothetical protein